MRWILLVMGLFCMLAGVAQMAFGVYTFDSSDHGGSWINVRGSLDRYFVDHPQRDLVHYQRHVALKVMKALDTSVEVQSAQWPGVPGDGHGAAGDVLVVGATHFLARGCGVPRRPGVAVSDYGRA